MLALVVVYALAAVINAHSDLFRFTEYQFTFSLSDDETLRRLINERDAFQCTETIPSIAHKICVQLDANNHLQYKYEADPEFSASRNTNNDNMISVNDDTNWKEFSYGQTSSHFNDDTTDSYQYVKQCRYLNGRKECVHYNTPSKTVTFGVKIPQERIPRTSVDFAHILPANIGTNKQLLSGMNMDQFISSMAFNPFAAFMPLERYNSAHEFEYGDALGYDRWAANAMNIDALQCMLCDIMNHLDLGNIFKSYGDFTYLFNEHTFDYDEDKDWELKLGEDKKCSAVIEGIQHKICATETSDGNVLISFENEAIVRRLMSDNDINALYDEFDGVILDFNDDNLWNDVTHINNEDTEFVRKCRAFQLAHFCATRGDNHYFQFHVKVGINKLHHKPEIMVENVEHKVNEMLGNLWNAANIAYVDDYDEYEYEQDLEDIVDKMENEYDYEGRDALADVLEQIADEIEEDLDEKVEDEYEYEQELEEMVQDIENEDEVEEILQQVEHIDASK